MQRHRARLQVSVILPVGAAFDTQAGLQRRAPRWMQRNGLEWLFRLIMEPRRLWRRYLVGNTQFIVLVLRQWARQSRGAWQQRLLRRTVTHEPTAGD